MSLVNSVLRVGNGRLDPGCLPCFANRVPPAAIAHYRLGEKIGAGGMGDVYRATDTKLNREVALKILPEAFAQDRDRMARFEREAQVLTPFLTTPANERDAALSPDGRFIAYASDESGSYQVYVQSFPGPGGKRQLSTNEGRFPRWTKGGREIVYVERPGRFMAVEVSTDGESLRSGSPELLFEGNFGGPGSWPRYDVSADGERFYVFQRVEQDSDETTVTFVLDFFDEVRRAVGE